MLRHHDCGCPNGRAFTGSGPGIRPAGLGPESGPGRFRIWDRVRIPDHPGPTPRLPRKQQCLCGLTRVRAQELLLVLVQDQVRAVGEEAQERLGAGLLAVLTAVYARSQPAASVLCSTVQRPKARR